MYGVPQQTMGGYSPLPGTMLPGTMPIGTMPPMGTMLPPTAGMGGMPPGAMHPGTTIFNAPVGTHVQSRGQQFYDPRFTEDPRFLSLWERDPSLKSVGSGTSAEKEPLKGAAAEHGKPPPKVETGPLHYITWFFTLVVTATAGYFIYSVVWQLLPSEAFLAFARLSYELWFPYFIELMYVLCAFAALAIICGLLASVGAFKMHKQVLKAAMGSAGGVGILLLLLTLICYHLGQAVMPDVVRVVNVICQDTSVWCGKSEASTPALATTAASATIESPGGGAIGFGAIGGETVGGGGATVNATPLPVRLLEDNSGLRYGRALLPSANAAIGRRLSGSEDSSAQAAIQYDQYLYKQYNQNADLLCEHVQEMCAPPPHFDVASTCMCSGQWDFANPEVSLLPGARRLDDSTPEASGPWHGSIGAYCGAWNAAVSGSVDWCFVYKTAECAGSLVSEVQTSDNQIYYRSTGPCTDEVEPRSEYVFEGAAQMSGPLTAAGVLGFLVVLLAGMAFGLTKVEPKAEPKKVTVAPKPEAPKPVTLEKQFEDAQRIAVTKLRDETPEAVKLQLYALYKQAKIGPPNQPRPNGYINGYELKKWTAWQNLNIDNGGHFLEMSREAAILRYIEAVKHIEE